MRLPAEAGELLVDLRPVGRLPYRWVFITVGLLILVGIAGNENGWKVIAFFIAPIVAVTWLLLHLFRELRLVCEHGLLVREFVRVRFVPWSKVRGVTSRFLSYKGARHLQYLIDDGGRRIRLPGPDSRRSSNELITSALQQIEQRAGIKLQAQR